MEISIEILILVSSVLVIILGGFVVLYRKMGELEVSTAVLTSRIENMLDIVTEDKKAGDDREKRLTVVESIVEHTADKVCELEGTVKGIDKRLTSVELEHYSYMNKHVN
jgi:hypothetical protein